jgi:hypothetical protein
VGGEHGEFFGSSGNFQMVLLVVIYIFINMSG